MAGTDTIDTDQDSVIDIDVLTNDSDVDSGNLTVSLPANTSTRGAAIAVKPDNQTVRYNLGDVFDSLPLGGSGSDSFEYTVHDNHPTEPGTSNGTVNLNIAGLNDAPQAQADEALTTENAPVTIDALHNDSDADSSDSKTLVSVNVVNPANQGGSAVIGNNRITWNPNLDFDSLKDGEETQVTLSYVMQDSQNAASIGSVVITVKGINDAPQGASSGNLANGQEDHVYPISEATLLEGFSDAEGDTLTVQNLTASHGILNAVPGGWEFTPDLNYNGEVILSYTVSDGQGGVADTITRAMNLTPVNDDPDAKPDTLITDEDQALTLDVTSNDDDIDGDTLTVFSVVQGAHGAVTFANGSVIYMPDQNYHGTDNFTYTVSDGQGGTDIETVQVTVNSVNDAPYVLLTQADQSAKALDPFQYALPADMFADPDNDVLTYTATMPAWLSFDSATQTFTGIPANTEAGEAVVTVTATDSSGEAAVTGFIINVAQNLNGVSSAVENAVPPITAADGTVGIAGDGNGDGISDSQQDNVTSIPTLNPDVYATFSADSPGVVITSVQNDTPLNTPKKMSAPYGIFSFNLENLTPGATVPMSIYLTGSWTLTHAGKNEWTNNNTGDVVNGYWKQMPSQKWKDVSTSITLVGDKLKIEFSLTDGDWTDSDGLVNGIIVDPGAPGFNNNVPVANDDQGSVNEDDILNFSVQDLLNNDTDLDEDNLIPSLVYGPLHGVLSQQPDGTYRYTPHENYNGLDSFIYKVNDGYEDSNMATVNITVNAVNDIPRAEDDADQVFEDATVTVSFDELMINDIDVDGTAKTIVAVDTAGTAGHVVIDIANRTISYSADADEFDLLATGNTAIDSFQYTLQGSTGEIDTATVTISVIGINDGDSNMLGTIQADALVGTSGEDRIKGNNGNDILNGGEGADDLFGENGDDNLLGGGSIDRLFGGNGNDKLDGGSGNDRLAGERGNDTLTGSFGNDVFLFAQGGGIDIITDFANDFDKIQIAADTGITAFSQLKITGSTINGIAYSTITMGNGGQVTLTGIPTAQLDAADFIFPV